MFFNRRDRRGGARVASLAYGGTKAFVLLAASSTFFILSNATFAAPQDAPAPTDVAPSEPTTPQPEAPPEPPAPQPETPPEAPAPQPETQPEPPAPQPEAPAPQPETPAPQPETQPEAPAPQSETQTETPPEAPATQEEPAVAEESTPREAGARKVLTIADVEVAFRWAPAGRFAMGSAALEAGRGSAEDQREIVLTRGFWLAETETTQRLWQAVMGTNPSAFQGEELPVENVSWRDCQEFVGKLNALGVGAFRLPTEAEWEYACRAGSETPYPWGKALNGDKANCNGVAPCGTVTPGVFLGKTTKVGEYEANAWGLFDMTGNVAEWCDDWYGIYSTVATTDPQGATEGLYRVARGGSWRDAASRARSAARSQDRPTKRRDSLGFRLALTDSE